MVLKVASSGLQNGPSAFQGSWDANANSPFLQSGVGFSGEYYIVSVAGNTTLDGNTNWKVGDWAIFNGATNQWEKISGGSGTNGIQIITDTTSNTNYNITLTSASSGNITTEYVDPTDLSFNPSTKTLKATNANVTGNLTATNATITNLTATNGNITNFSSSNATITGGSISNTTLSNVTGGSITIVNDTNSNTTYNLLMTTSSGGNVTTEYVDATTFTFNPAVGSGGPFSGALHTPSLYVSGYLILGDTGSTVLSGWEAYPDGYLVFYKSNIGASTYDRSMVTNPSNWLGIGVDGSQEEPPVYAPLYVQSTTANPQVMIANGTNSSHGLSVYVDGSQNASITNYNASNLNLGTSNTTYITVTSAGGVSFGSSGTAYGTSGQVLVSAGNGPPAWKNASSANIAGLGTMATQNSNNVTITGGSINVQTTNHTATTTGNATYATSSLLLVPAGFFEIDLNGTVVKVPYYAV